MMVILKTAGFIFFLLLLLLLLFGPFVALYLFLERRFRRRLFALSRGLGAIGDVDQIPMRIGRIPITITFTNRPRDWSSSNTSRFLVFHAPIGPLPELRMRRASRWDALAEKLGRSRVTDDVNDRMTSEVHIEFADAVSIEKLLSDAIVRRTVPELLAAGIHDLMLDHEGLTAYGDRGLTRSFEPAAFEAVLRIMGELAAALRGHVLAEAAAPVLPKKFARIGGWLAGGAGSLGGAGMILAGFLSDSYEAVGWHGCLWGLASATAGIFPMIVISRIFLREWTENSERVALIVTLAFFACWFLTTGGLNATTSGSIPPRPNITGRPSWENGSPRRRTIAVAISSLASGCRASTAAGI